MKKFQLGLIGLAVMGKNLARNINNKGNSIVVYNRTTEVTHDFISEYGNEDLGGAETLEDFVKKLESPRKVLLMVKAGEPVNAVINSLIPLLERGDLIVDCGNSNFNDTQKRADMLNKHGILFLGTGVSGGEEGALNGPSIMPGGSEKGWEMMKGVFTQISARDFKDRACVTYIGKGGAGHHVKMVHNGIEYAMMQALAESYDLLRTGFGLDARQISDIFAGFNEGRLNSFLVEITEKVLKAKEQDGSFLIDKVLDKAKHKGTGSWTVIDAAEQGIPVTTVADAFFARTLSAQRSKRTILNDIYLKDRIKPSQDLKAFVSDLEQTLYFTFVMAFNQGLDLIKATSDEHDWGVNLSEVIRIWQGGCIIRAKLLIEISEALIINDDKTILESPQIAKQIIDANQSVRQVTKTAIDAQIPTPVISAARNYFDAITTDNLPANLIQAQRDFFGAHTFERTDKDGVYHADWAEDVTVSVA